MMYTSKMKNFSLFRNDAAPFLTMAQVKEKTGCDVILNGTWYNNSPVKAVGNLKIDGVVLSKEYDRCLGYGWEKGEQPVMQWTDMSNTDYFFCACPMIFQGEKLKLNYTTEVGGERGRSGEGQLADGSWIFICTKDGTADAMTPEELQTLAYNLGCVDFMMNDGGGSAECITPAGSITTTRTIYNFLCGNVDGESGTSLTTETKASYFKGIDVSENNKAIDWGKAENEIDFAMIRAVVGTRLDYQFARNIAECNRIGIPCGVYAFSYADNAAEAVAEAKLLLEAIKPYKVELPVCFDFECDSVANLKKKGVTVTMVLASEMAKAFLSTIEAAGYYAMNYTSPYFAYTYYDKEVLAKYDLWLASWYEFPDYANPPKCGIWQHANDGSVTGITGDVDMDVTYRDYPAVIKAADLNNLAVTQPAEAELAAAWVKEQGVSDGTRPTETATRQEVWIMLYRARNK